MSSNDGVVFIDQDGVGESKLPDTASDLPNLMVGVGAGIVGIGNEC
jgi:hypothetical protein